MALIIGVLCGYAIGMSRSPSVHVAQEAQSMVHQMDDMVGGLKGLRGAELEEAFLRDMIVHHEGAIQMAELLRKETKRPELLTLASDIITAQTNEVDVMEEWKSEWFGEHE